MRNLRKLATWALLACAAGWALSGCGGGGGDDKPQPAVRFAAEGFWGGPDVNSAPVGLALPPWNGSRDYFWGTPTTAGNHVGLIVSPNGDTWGVYTANGVVIGALHGRLQTSGTGIQIVGARFFDIGSPGQSVDYSGAVAPRSQLDLVGADGTHFITTYDSNYDRPASLVALSGVYTGTGGTTLGKNPGTNYSISISSGGVVTLPPDAVGCSGSGTATPRMDKNVFDLSIRFSGAQCALGDGEQVNGIAVAENGHLLLLGATLNTQSEFVYVSN